MSLIPSESYSFPDHFTSTRAASRKPKNIEPDPEPLEPPRTTPAIVALPNPKPQPQPEPAPVVSKENPSPVRKIAPPVPSPALRRASAPPPRVSEPPVRRIALPATLKPKVRWNNRAPAVNPAPPMANSGNSNGEEQITGQMPQMPARNVIQMRPAQPPQVLPPPGNVMAVNPQPIVQRRPTVRPENRRPQNPLPIPPIPPVAKMTPPAPKAPRPVQAAPVAHVVAPPAAPIAPPQTDFFEMFAQSGETVASKRRRNEKMRRFIVCEGIAVGILLPLAIVGIFFHPENAVLHWIVNVLTISAAVVSAVIPIVFFAVTPTLPEIER